MTLWVQPDCLFEVTRLILNTMTLIINDSVLISSMVHIILRQKILSHKTCMSLIKVKKVNFYDQIIKCTFMFDASKSVTAPQYIKEVHSSSFGLIF